MLTLKQRAGVKVNGRWFAVVAFEVRLNDVNQFGQGIDEMDVVPESCSKSLAPLLCSCRRIWSARSAMSRFCLRLMRDNEIH